FRSIDLPTFAASDQAAAIGAPGHPADPDGQLPPDPVPGACSHVPQQHATPIGGASQPGAIRTPGQAPEGGVGVVAVADDLDTASGGRLPESNSIIQAGTGQQAAIGTPFYPVHAPLMAAQSATRRSPSEAFHLPD